jgi:hypothetical protein
MRANNGWRDVTIGNVSSRGLMIRGISLPPRGTFVEVRHRSVCVVGRIVWSHGARCGIRTQDVVDIAALLSQSPIQPRKAEVERRQAPRPRAKATRPYSATRASETNRRFARIFDWTVVAAGGALAAAAAASAASSALSEPMDQVHIALQKENGG